MTKISFNMDNDGKEKKETPKAPAPVITQAQLAELLENQRKLNDQNIALQKQIKEVTKGTTKDDLILAIRELRKTDSEADKTQVMDEGDYDEKGQSYYYYGLMTVLSTYKDKAGRNTTAPIETIIFEPKAGITQGSGRDQNILYISEYHSNSKKEMAWIESHPWFVNGLITKRYDANTTVQQVLRSQRSAKFLQSVNTFSPAKVIQELRQRNIDFGDAQDDLPRMRALLVESLVDKEIGEEIARSEKLVKDQSKDNYLEKAAEIA